MRLSGTFLLRNHSVISLPMNSQLKAGACASPSDVKLRPQPDSTLNGSRVGLTPNVGRKGMLLSHLWASETFVKKVLDLLGSSGT